MFNYINRCRIIKIKLKLIFTIAFVSLFLFSCDYTLEKDTQKVAELLCEREQLYEKLFDFDDETDKTVSKELDIMDEKIDNLRKELYAKYDSDKQREKFDKIVRKKITEICNK